MRLCSRLNAARVMYENPGPMMNLLGETVIDLYEEIMILIRRREQEQYLLVEFFMRLKLAITQGGDEFRCYRTMQVDVIELAVVGSTVWNLLNNRTSRDYAELEKLQAKLRLDAPRIALGIMRRTRRQGHAFRYWFPVNRPVRRNLDE